MSGEDDTLEGSSSAWGRTSPAEEEELRDGMSTVTTTTAGVEDGTLTTDPYTTPKTDTGAFQGLPEHHGHQDVDATPTLHTVRASRRSSGQTDSSGLTMPELSHLRITSLQHASPPVPPIRRDTNDSDYIASPLTARPTLQELASSSTITSISHSLPFRSSPDLHELASGYSEPSTTLVVADGNGYFENVNLATPTVEHFQNDGDDAAFQWPPRARTGGELARRKGKGRSMDSAEWAKATRSTAGSRGHHRTTSSLSSFTSITSGDGGVSASRGTTNAVNGHSEPSTSDAATFRARSNSSSSSIAESAGTAAEGTDSEFEEAVEAVIRSRAGSRRTSDADRSARAGKRLSSFAPIPQLNLNGSSSNLAADGASADPAPTPTQMVPSSSRRTTLSPPPAGLGSSSVTPHASASMTPTESASSQVSTASAQTTFSTQTHDSRSSHASGPPEVTAIGSAALANGAKPTYPRKPRRTKPSPLEKVISKTRQRDLPPKKKVEERKHLREYKEMLNHSKATEKSRRQQAEQKRAEKEKAAAQALSAWEKDILPNWKAVLRDDKLREVWWSGTMPPRHRARLWQGCIGNGLALGKASYARALSLVQTLRNSGKFPQEIIDAIDLDIEHTLPQTKLFQSTGPLHSDLQDLLFAQSVFWSTTPSYAPGTSQLAAILLVSMPAQEAFLSLVNLINKSLLKTFYRGSKEDVEAYYRVFSTLLADKMPKVYRNFVAHDIKPSLYLAPWLVTLYIKHLGFDTSTRIMDVFVLEGDQFLFRLALSLLQILEGRLFNPDHEELAELFRGDDRGARAIVAREQGKEESEVQPWEVYELLGATEEAVFETVKALDWKEATFQRLLIRELPDADA